ncbi:class I SAM-dependent methyltransferase [Kouleothrix sp.]|uniref:class I SAM-dependent methyltransferase n=1 Tax=Kouleothrix sp. TaxID=2779161 RepID=UPI00391AB4E9
MPAQAPPYEQVHTRTVALGGQAFQLITKPGMPDWDTVGPAERLLYEAARPPAGARVALLASGNAALAAALALRDRPAALLFSNLSAIGIAMARRTFAANALGNAQVLDGISLLPEHAGSCGLALLLAPPDRRLARRRLLEAFGALAEGGALLLAGANDHGIRSIIDDAGALFGGAAVLAYGGGCRVAQALKRTPGGALPAWAGAPGIAPGSWAEFEAELRGVRLRLYGLPGVFAHDRLDEGTRLLIETIEQPTGLRVLDLGCGGGAIGAVAARLGAAHAELADANMLAVAAATATLARNGIGNASVHAADGVPPERHAAYDLVLSNPPFHVGKAVTYDIAQAFIAQARRALRPGGRFVLVANQFLRYDQLLRASFARADCLAQSRGYRVWAAAA